MRRDTREALAFGLALVAVIAVTALGFNALAGGVSIGADSAPDGGDDGMAGEHSSMESDEHDSMEGGEHDGMEGEHGGMEGGEHSGDMDGMEMDGGMNMDMQMVDGGTVVNGNSEELPPGCDEVNDGQTVTVHGGYEYAEGGESFSFDRERIEVEPCTRVTVTFVNEDSVRHQWMLHGLPTETYPMGMFNVEVDGPGSATGTFVTPAADTTLDTHCSLPQHEQKGMHMAVVVGDGGDGGDH